MFDVEKISSFFNKVNFFTVTCYCTLHTYVVLTWLGAYLSICLVLGACHQ